jgi:hypothetical protein
LKGGALFLFGAGLVPELLRADTPVPKESELGHAIAQAAKCCLAWLNPQEEFLPTGGYEVAHDTGRWWDAMLRYEAVTGVRIPEAAEQAMMKNLRSLTDNSAALLTSALCNPHNLRETLLAYTALVKHRKSEWALLQGRTLIQAIYGLLEADGQMNYEKLAEMTGKPLTKDLLMMKRFPAGEWFNATGSTGRALEAVVWFHEATGDALAKDLATRLAEIHLRQTISADGKVRAELLDPNTIGHTHSYCGTLRGLLLYGLLVGDKKYIEAVERTYRKGLWGTSISYSGWTPHDQGKLRFPDKEGDPIAEHASCGDVAQIALWLALRAGKTDLLDDVERMIRARLLPSQIVDAGNPRKDGAWGVYSHPFGYGAILDVFAAVLHSLADFQKNIVTTEEDGRVSVNLHFATETPSVKVSVKRGEKAEVRVTMKQAQGLRIRVPKWATHETVHLMVDDKKQVACWDGNYVVVVQQWVKRGSVVLLNHDLPSRETTEQMPVSHRKFNLSWRGDEIMRCEPKVPIYPGR